MQLQQASAITHLLPLLQAQAQTQTLPVSPTSWIPFAIIAVFTVILVAAIVYMLSGIIRSENAKQWARFQIYEALLSLILIIAFGSLIFLFFLSPQTVYGKLNIVPSGCTGATQLFTLASCDVAQFNNGAFAFAQYSFIVSYLTVFPPPPELTYYPLPEDENVYFKLTPSSFVPSDTGQILSFFYSAIMFALIFNQVQLIMLSGAVLFLSVFLSIGLIARTFGFARTFAGAMIAFGLGIGILYPLMVSLTYGYIDVNANVTCLQTFVCSTIGTAGVMMQLIINPASVSLSQNLGTGVGNLMVEIGYIVVGLTLIPLLNVVIVDAFIIDFSKAVGEKMSFGTLFSNFL